MTGLSCGGVYLENKKSKIIIMEVLIRINQCNAQFAANSNLKYTPSRTAPIDFVWTAA